jgi:hypothetical protein
LTPITPGPATIKSRAVDNSGNVQDLPAEVTVTFVAQPFIVSRSPADGETNVSLNANILVTFNRAMDPASVNESTIFLSPAGQIPATVSYDAATFTVTLDPIAPLEPGRTYTMSVMGGDAGVKDLEGSPLEFGTETWSFKTAPRPRVVFTTPADRATVVSTGVAPRAIFSKPLDPTSVNTETVLLHDGANNFIPVVVSYSSSDNAVTLAPQSPLQSGQRYTVILKGGDSEPHITDSTGIPLLTDYPWVFTPSSGGPTPTPTPTPAPTPAPTPIPTPTPALPLFVNFLTPTNGSANVRVDTNVVAEFNESVDPATVNASTIELIDPAGSIVPATVSYKSFPSQATLDPVGLLSAGVTYTARVKGGNAEPRVKDLAGNPLLADVAWIFTTPPAPQVLSVTPPMDAVDIPVGAAFRVTFSKELNIFTVFSTKGDNDTILLHDAAGNSIPVRILYLPGAFAVSVVPFEPLQPLQTYTVTLKGGPDEPNIRDMLDTPLESDYTWSFTTAAAPPPIPTSTIFASAVTPANPISDDSQAVEVGMKFRSDVDGFITGVRFYKGSAANGGRHVGHLWAGDGTLLGSSDFFAETDSGWQQRLFLLPIPIMANTTYVVSYFAPQGHYAADPRYFASTGVDTPPLHALRDGVDGGDGVLIHSPTGEFPTGTDMSTNYYVDVVFSPAISPPQVLSTTPSPGGTFIASNSGPPFSFTATFTEPLDPTSVNAETVLLRDTANNPVPCAISLEAGNHTVRITPQRSLVIVTGYTVVLRGGFEPHITSASGAPLAADYEWSFMTDAALRIALLKETMPGDRVTSGANFIAMRPDRQFAAGIPASLLLLDFQRRRDYENTVEVHRRAGWRVAPLISTQAKGYGWSIPGAGR